MNIENQLSDWNYVASLGLKGCARLTDGVSDFYGPISLLSVVNDAVQIETRFIVKRPRGNESAEWEVVSRRTSVITTFKNGAFPFIHESTLKEGARVRFGMHDNTLYLDPVDDFDPESIPRLFPLEEP